MMQRAGCVSLACTPSRFLPGKSQEQLEKDLRCWASLAEAPKVDGSSMSPLSSAPYEPHQHRGAKRKGAINWVISSSMRYGRDT